MTDTRIDQHYGLLLIGLFCILLAGCSGIKDPAETDKSRTGAINLQLAWQTDGASVIALAPPSGDVCVDFLIDNIEVEVRNSSGGLTKSQQWPCANHAGSMVDIPAGSGYTVAVNGLVGSETQWQGASENPVTVVAGQISDPVVIEMAYVGNDQTPPTASISPADLAVNVPTDTAITIVFDEAVVEASLDSGSITVSDGSSNVVGTITYDADTYTATFQPSQELVISTTYTITVTTNVVDLAGLNMAQDHSSSFSTSTVWFVDGGAIAGSGQSWADSFNTIPAAVTAAGDGDQIWVKNGTYALSGQVVISKPVELMGGFAGTEAQHHQRDWQTLATVVDGNDTTRGMFLSANAIVDGFTITGGAAKSVTDPKGGGIYIDAADPSILNCTFSDNVAGSPNGHGGAIYIASGNPVISNCSFNQNNANSGTEGYGGAIYNYQGGPTISDSTFYKNRSSGGFGNYAGAIYNYAAQPTTTISGCLFDGNSSFGEVGSGGAIYNTNSNITIIACRFQNNSSGGLYSGYGAGIYNSNSDTIIQNCIFNDNSAGSRYAGRGGAIYNSVSEATITNCTFASNDTYADDPADTYGGGIANFSSNPIITNSILWDNLAQNGNQIYDDAGSSASVTYCNIDQNGYTIDGNLRKYPRFGAGFHLRADSPCIDQGDIASAPAIDIDAESRPQSSAADMGADEFRDSDGDKIPDYWEIMLGLNIAADDAATDSDSDLLPALSEYQLDTDPNSAETVASATNHRGTWSSSGDHTASDKSTPTGVAINTYRSFFIFDLGSPAATFTAAAVRLELTAYTGITAEETLQVYDVGTSTAALEASGSGQTAIYDDLGSGVFLGDFDVTPADQGMVLDIALNGDAVDYINAAAGGSIAIGLKLETLGNGALKFSDTDEVRIHQLVLVEE